MFRLSELGAQPLSKVDDNGSNGLISIYGRTNISSFRLNASLTEHNLRYLYGRNVYQLKIPVSSFKARNNLIEHDFLQMINAASYPEIVIFIPASAFESAETINVEIEVAGKSVEKGISTKIISPPGSENKEIRGETSINWQELGLQPPRRFMGLLEIQETIFITFVLKLSLLINAVKY
ncbi:MAG: hypothetical protein WBJ37_09285 [Bacteroidales bacterium]